METALVTVGTTKFEDLVLAVQKKAVVNSFKALGLREVHIQTGDSATLEGIRNIQGLKFIFFRYRTEILSLIDAVDLVISHAGAGSALDVLDRKKPLIVVPNSSLMNNHQDELAEYLDVKSYALKATVDNLPEALIRFSKRRKEFVALPAVDSSKFEQLLTQTFHIGEKFPVDLEYNFTKREYNNKYVVVFLVCILGAFVVETYLNSVLKLFK